MPLAARSMLEISRIFRAPSRFRPSIESHSAWRVVRISSSGIEWLTAQSGSGPTTALVPSEQVLLLAVDLPAQRRRDRLAALPWAIEDALAEPLAMLHLVLGPEIAPRRYLVAVIRHSVMRAWGETLAAAGLTRCRMVPDALALPRPADDGWSIAVDSARVLARGGEATAFAIEAPLFPLAWESAGRPQLELYGEEPASDLIPVSPADDDRPLGQIMAEAAARSPLNLAQGVYAPEGDAGMAALRRVAMILGGGLIAYAAILAADTAAVIHLAGRRTGDAARLHAEIIPADRRSANVAADIEALSRTATAPHGAFLPLMSRAAIALRPLAGELSLRTLVFSAEDRSLTFGVEVRDFAALQRVEAALTGAGIAVETGAAAAAAGGVEAKVKLREPDAR